jgi:hypothetical protein
VINIADDIQEAVIGQPLSHLLRWTENNAGDLHWADAA